MRLYSIAYVLLLTLSLGCAASETIQPVAGAKTDELRPAPLFDNLGDHHHAITTSSPLAQRYFGQGLTLAWAFNHVEAGRSFEAAAKLDPNCAMAWWGVALVLGPHVNAPMNDADVPKAYEAVQRAAELANAGNVTPA